MQKVASGRCHALDGSRAKNEGAKMEIWKSISCYFFAQPFFAHLEIGATWDSVGARH
jgi:hypothetical protein